MNLPALHIEASKQTRKFLEAVKKEALEKESNCAPWSVSDLINHIVSENLWVKDIMDGKTVSEVGDKYEGDMLGSDFLKAYDESVKSANEAFSESGAMEKTVHLSYGDLPGSVYCGHRIIDLVIHGWDIAHSTGQEDILDIALVEAAYELVLPEAKDLSASGYYGKEIRVGEDAPLQDKLLGLLGRHRS